MEFFHGSFFHGSRSAARLGLSGVALAVVLSGCGGDAEQPAPAQTAPESTSGASATPSADPGGAGSPTTAGTPQPSAASPTGGGSDTGQARAGSWPVADAGTVDFQIEGGALKLVSADAKPGWNQRVAVQSAKEIEVHFTQGDTDWKFEAEIDSDGLEISRERDTRPAEDGSYEVLEAATVAFTSSGNSVKLGKVTPAEGWKESTRDVSVDDIEIDFTKGSATAEFEVEIDRGQVKLELNQKVVGAVPR